MRELFDSIPPYFENQPVISSLISVIELELERLRERQRQMQMELYILSSRSKIERWEFELGLDSRADKTDAARAAVAHTAFLQWETLSASFLAGVLSRMSGATVITKEAAAQYRLELTLESENPITDLPSNMFMLSQIAPAHISCTETARCKGEVDDLQRHCFIGGAILLLKEN